LKVKKGGDCYRGLAIRKYWELAHTRGRSGGNKKSNRKEKAYMKRIIVIALALAIAFTLCFGTIALADDPTEVTVTWNGSGGVGESVNTGDTTSGFTTIGDYIAGSYTAKDFNDNPYNYTVDSFSAYLNASVTNGYISSGATRVNSYVPMYGAGGQTSLSYVEVVNGTASMAYRSTTNYAAMGDCSYTYQLPGGHNITAIADLYTIIRSILDGQGNSGYVGVNGTGSATLDCMGAGASGNGGVSFGSGCGCYTDASFSAVGNGYFEVTGTGNNSVTFNGLGMSSGGGSLSIIANFVNSFSIADYSLTAN
jgi:hypothetical protein